MHFQRVLHIYVGWEQCFLNYYIAMSMWEKWQETHIVSPHESTEAIKIVLIRRQEKIGEQMSCHLTYSKRLPGGPFTRTLRYPGESPRHGCFAVIFYHGHGIDFRTRGVLTATFSVDWCPLWRHQWNLFRSSPRRIYQSFFFPWEANQFSCDFYHWYIRGSCDIRTDVRRVCSQVHACLS